VTHPQVRALQKQLEQVKLNESAPSGLAAVQSHVTGFVMLAVMLILV
jgi:hypothetical protein